MEERRIKCKFPFNHKRDYAVGKCNVWQGWEFAIVGIGL